MSLELQNSGNSSGNNTTLFLGGSVIYLQGKAAKNLYIVKRGEVRLIRNENQKLHVLQICTTGDILNDISVLTNQAPDHTAVAKSDVEIVMIDAKDVRSVIEKCPKWIPDIFKTLCERLVDSQEIINEHNLKNDQLDKNFIISKDEEKILLKKIQEFK